jgi:hypothetical protein
LLDEAAALVGGADAEAGLAPATLAFCGLPTEVMLERIAR